jgi:hypothetical protein
MDEADEIDKNAVKEKLLCGGDRGWWCERYER